MLICSFATKSSAEELFGETACWIAKFALVCRALKMVLGGFFMSIYRLICMKKPDIAMSHQKQRKITNELFFLEWITLIFLLGLHLYGTKIRGTSLALAMLRGRLIMVVEYYSETGKLNRFLHLNEPLRNPFRTPRKP